MIHTTRLHILRPGPKTAAGQFVLYWMQAAQREACNHALEFAIEQANERALPLVVCFGLDEHYPDANERHFAFLLEGLAETARALAGRGIPLVLRAGSPPTVAAELADQAALVVTDRGYLRHQVAWRKQLARAVRCRVVQVETDVVVPVAVASNKAEYAARTLRPKHQRHWATYLQPLQKRTLQRSLLDAPPAGLDATDPEALLAGLHIDRTVPRTDRFLGGTAQARRLLKAFLHHRLGDYAERRSDPSLGIESHMSPYLHFGQISPLEIALNIRASQAPSAEMDAYLEELLIRRELAINFVTYTPNYDRYGAIPAWARATLAAHQSDRRPRRYRASQLRSATTDDPYWNAAMREMVRTGKMHNYMRMYWGKKILEWTASPKTAYRWMLAWNNRYFLDGRDPASYANVAWIFGLHDRPWQERDVFGTVRYMNAAGLERKFDIAAYARQWSA